MSTLIGGGSHARDIRNTRQFTHYVDHHDQFTGDDSYIIGINDPRLRHHVSTYLKGLGQELSWVHPQAWLDGVDILSGTHINYGVHGVRTKIGRHCTISPGVTLCGDIRIGNRVLIGAGATIGDRVTIGDGATIGMGAVVLPETYIPSGETWVGVPARKR